MQVGKEKRQDRSQGREDSQEMDDQGHTVGVGNETQHHEAQADGKNNGNQQEYMV